MTKVCSKCKEEKPVTTEFFQKHCANKDGFNNLCKTCYSEHHKKLRSAQTKEVKQKEVESNKKWRQKNPEKVKEQQARSYRNNIEKRKLHEREYRARPEIKKRDKEYKQKNKNRALFLRNQRYHSDLKYRQKQLDLKYQYKKRKLEKDPGFKLKETLRARVTQFLKHNQRVKPGSITNLLGCSKEQLRQYIEQQFQPGMSWDNYGHGKDKWVIDHIIPLSIFNFKSEYEVQKAVNYKNLQPLWFEDNKIKSDLVIHSTIPLTQLPDTLPLLII